MKNRQEFNLEIEDELAAIEQEIDEIRRQRREEEQAQMLKRLKTVKFRSANGVILPGEDE